MALELYMLGLIVRDMSKSLEFYRRLGIVIPEGSEDKTHVEIKMGKLTFFLDSRPTRWDAQFVRDAAVEQQEPSQGYRSILEFYLETQAAVLAKYDELMRLGYQSFRAPYEIPFGMCFAMVKDPDENVVLLSGVLDKKEH
jgi:predicted lactoylglutathione lyase